MTKQLALDLADQDLGARGRRLPGSKSAPKATSSKATAGPQRRTGGTGAAVAYRFPIVDEQWRLDPHTREIGLKGVEEARRVLAAIAGADAA